MTPVIFSPGLPNNAPPTVLPVFGPPSGPTLGGPNTGSTQLGSTYCMCSACDRFRLCTSGGALLGSPGENVSLGVRGIKNDQKICPYTCPDFPIECSVKHLLALVVLAIHVTTIVNKTGN